MTKYTPNVNGKSLKDDGVYSHHRRNVIVPEQDWDLHIRQNVITHLPILIEQELRNQLVDLATNSCYETYYNLNMFSIDNTAAAIEIKKHFSMFEEVNSCTLLKLEKGANIWPHSDPNRHVNIYIPLYPEGNDYQPLEIYYNNKIYGIPKNTNKVYAWNTRILHGVINNCEYDRYNLQLSIYIPYVEFFQKYKDLIDA